MSKRIPSAVAVAVLLASLVGCSSSPAPAPVAAACDATKPGAISAGVDVSGSIGSAPTVTFPTPATVKATQRTVVTKGKGAVAEAGTTVTVHYTVYNATTGVKIGATSYLSGGTADMKLDQGQLLPGLMKALECSKPGSRIAAVIPPGDAFGAAGSADLGIGATDSMVFVLDVLGIKEVLEKANGADQPAPDGFPTVVLAKDGSPTVTIPKGDPPAELKIANLKKGTGATVAEGDTVTMNYAGLVWATGTVFDSSWANGVALTAPTTGLISGFTKALVGQKVGSQVIAIIPPSEGYGTAGSGEAIGGTDTLVFVVDILATAQ